jgi:hypothetical protein
VGQHIPPGSSTSYGVKMTFIEKAKAKRSAYLAAGYTCTEIVQSETSAKFSACDQYGVSRDMIFGDDMTSPLLEKAKLKAPVVVEPPVVEPTPVKKTRKKKGE